MTLGVPRDTLKCPYAIIIHEFIFSGTTKYLTESELNKKFAVLHVRC